MNYDETISYLFEQLPMFQRVGAAAYRKDLRNTLALASLCDNPEEGLKCVHLAGTNGKGSTAHGLASVMQATGHKTGLMTSPHYRDFRERIRIDGVMIEKDYVVDWVARHKRGIERISASFFELTVIMGFCYFKDKGVDIAIIETGMGGRLDSTNIVSPEVSIITPIGLDHQAFLGDSLDKIALEKAGIIKQDTPVVVAVGNEEVLPIIKSVATSRNAEVQVCVRSNYPIHTDLKGDYQQDNMTTVLLTVEALKKKGWKLPDTKVVDGLSQILKSTGFVGRWQQLGLHPRIIADSAHNEQGIKAAMVNLEKEKYRKLLIVIGMVSDKDVDTVLTLLPMSATYYFCQAKVIRALPCEQLAQEGQRLGLVGESYGSVKAALTAAKDAADKEDLILIIGSVFTVAEVV